MTNKPELTDNHLTRIIESAKAVISALAGTNDDVHPDNSTKMCSLWDSLNDDDAPPEVVLSMAIELQERRKADSAEPVAWTDEQELRDVEKDGCGYLFKANPISPNADPRRVIKLYRHAQPAQEREQIRRNYAEDVNSKQDVKIGIYERIYGLLRECPGAGSIYSVAPIEGECIPHGVLAHTGCISFYCNFGHLHIAEPAAFTGYHTHSLSGGTND